jgi:hypothetical protein
MEDYNYRPIFEIIIDENDEQSGMIRNSWVKNPAVGIEKFAFESAQKQKLVFADASRKNCFMSCSILCDTPILRRTDDGEEFYVVFTEESIRKINNKLFKENKIHEVTMHHNENMKVEGVYLVESFISDKKRVYSPLFDVPDGSLIQTYYVEDDDMYEKLLNDDNFTGYSIEVNARIQQMFSASFDEMYLEQRVKDIAFSKELSDEEKELAIKKILGL